MQPDYPDPDYPDVEIEDESDLPGIVRWFFESYRRLIDTSKLEGSRAFKKWLGNATVGTPWMSGINRMQTFQLLKFGYPLRRAGYRTCAFTMRAGDTDEPSIFAYAYWPVDAGDSEPGEPGPPEYACLSGTYTSQDGEYRKRFVQWPGAVAMRERLALRLDPVEAGLLKLVGSGELRIEARGFPQGEFEPSPRMGLLLLTLSIAADGRHIMDGRLPAHLTPKYAKTLERIWRKMGLEWDIRSAFMESEIDKCQPDPYQLVVGQKLRPLTLREVAASEDIFRGTWREVWIERAVSDLVLNRVAPMFPLFGNWAALDGGCPAFFDNPPMRQMYSRSDKAARVVDRLREARNEVDPAAKLTDHLVGQLDAQIHEPIAFAQSHLITSDAVLLTVQEHLGDTFGGLLVTPSDKPHREMKHTPGFGPEFGPRYLFDLCYGALALHTRTGCVHGDLHLNNMIVSPVGAPSLPIDPDGTPHVPFPGHRITIAYVAGDGEADTYLFRHMGLYAVIIDFSRAIMGPAARGRIASAAGDAKAEAFFRDQVGRALRTLHHFAPTFTEKHRGRITSMALADPDAFFRALTAIDYLAIGRNMGALLRRLPAARPDIEVSPDSVALAGKIEKLALAHLIAGLSGKDVPHAGAAIIPKVFRPWRYSAAAAKDTLLVDAYAVGLPIRYSGTDYKDFPPWARIDELEKRRGDATLEYLIGDQGGRPYFDAEAATEAFGILQEEARLAADDPPAALASSW